MSHIKLVWAMSMDGDVLAVPETEVQFPKMANQTWVGIIGSQAATRTLEYRARGLVEAAKGIRLNILTRDRPGVDWAVVEECVRMGVRFRRVALSKRPLYYGFEGITANQYKSRLRSLEDKYLAIQGDEYAQIRVICRYADKLMVLSELGDPHMEYAYTFMKDLGKPCMIYRAEPKGKE